MCFKFHKLLIVFLWSITCCYSQQQAETNVANGLTTTHFNTQLGKITIYLPEHNANERISGSIVVEPSGNTEKKKEKNKTQLQEYQVIIGEYEVNLKASTFTLTTPEADSKPLSLLDDKKKVVASTNVPLLSTKKPKKQSTFIPAYVVAGDPAKIIVSNNGNIANSSIFLNNTNANILAATETDVFFRVPVDLKGKVQIHFQNDTTNIDDEINVLQLQISADKLNLLKAESTNLKVIISGLEGLEEEVPLTLTNNSPSNISLEGGNHQEIIIPSNNDTYQISQTIRATQGGGFSISATIQPSENTNEQSTNNLLCNCYIEGYSYLISAEACKELGGNCNESSNDLDVVENEQVSLSNFNLDFPIIIYAENQLVSLQIKDYNKNDCVAVIFSYKPINSENWLTIGSDTTIEDGLIVPWEPQKKHNGVFEIQAQVVNKSNTTSKKTSSIYLNTISNTFENDSLNVSFTVLDSDIKHAEDKARKTDDDIDDLEDEIFENWKKRYAAEDKKQQHEDDQNKLITIDKVLDSIPKAYKDALKKIVDSLTSLKKQLPEAIDSNVLQKAIDDAQSRVDDCQDRLEKLKKEQQDLEAERDKLKAETDAVLEEMDALMKANGMTGGYGYHADGRYWYGYVGDENSNGDVMYTEKYNQLKSKLHGLKKQYLKTLKRLNELPNEIADAEKDCDELNDALVKAKTAKENADLHSAAELDADDICRQIERLLIPLWQWCVKNPEHCDFREAIEELMEKCPKDSSQLDDFWNDFNDLVSRKKEEEAKFGKAAEDEQKKIDDIDDDIAGLEDQISDLEDQKRKDLDAADALRRQQAAEAAEAKAAADARKRERDKQKKDDDKIKDLIKKASTDEAGDDAFKNLLKGMGLDLLDEATGNAKLGKIIGGLLVIKDMPDCACKMFEMLKEAVSAQLKGDGLFRYIFTNEYIRQWNSCANLPVFSSIMIGAKELSDAIGGMSKEQCRKTIAALDQAIRVQCK